MEYIGDAWWQETERMFRELYDQAKAAFVGFGAWTGRTSHDMYNEGMTAEASRQKHLNECRVVLGLDPVAPVPPEKPVVDKDATLDTVRKITEKVYVNYPELFGPYNSDDDALAAAEEFIRRCIWQCKHEGVLAGRQQNPSGAISQDKFSFFLIVEKEGSLMPETVCYWTDVMTIGTAEKDAVLQWQPSSEGAIYVPDDGIPNNIPE